MSSFFGVVMYMGFAMLVYWDVILFQRLANYMHDYSSTEKARVGWPDHRVIGQFRLAIRFMFKPLSGMDRSFEQDRLARTVVRHGFPVRDLVLAGPFGGQRAFRCLPAAGLPMCIGGWVAANVQWIDTMLQGALAVVLVSACFVAFVAGRTFIAAPWPTLLDPR